MGRLVAPLLPGLKAPKVARVVEAGISAATNCTDGVEGHSSFGATTLRFATSGRGAAALAGLAGQAFISRAIMVFPNTLFTLVATGVDTDSSQPGGAAKA